MYICCALVGVIKDSVSQNARCNSKKKWKPESVLLLNASFIVKDSWISKRYCKNS